MSRILIIANRLPVSVTRKENGFDVTNSPGGLATGLASLGEEMQIEWIGWPGLPVESEADEKQIAEKLGENCHPVFMNEVEEENFYQGFSNETIWPLFHCFTECVAYEKTYWEYYRAINERFCDKVLEVARDGDVIWVHDYHLMLLPRMLKNKLNGNSIGYFLHIPFPSYELFRTLPWREEILNGLLGADLIGFHTYEYMRHFYSSVYRILGLECNIGEIISTEGSTHMDSFPMGINFDKFNKSKSDEKVASQIATFKNKFGNFKLILSVDRLDYTKGILHRLKAFAQLLEEHPELRGKVSLIMITVPSRVSVEKYKNLKENIDETVGNINGEFSTLEWTPVHYFYRSIPFEELTALYNLSDVGLVTPLRDGMNLVAKEYVASKQDNRGVLILSEMAGSSIELEGALKVNPNNQEDIVNAIHKALHMPEDEQARRILAMQEALKENDVDKWAKSFVRNLESVAERKLNIAKENLSSTGIRTLTSAFSNASNPLIVLDYDGTLVNFREDPGAVKPPVELLELLQDLSKQSTVVISSGREYRNLDDWFGKAGLELIAEHGMWCKRNGNWQKESDISNEWKGEVKDIMKEYTSKTPGAFIEEKSNSLAFHYRKTDKFLAELRLPQLMESLSHACAMNQLELLKGNKVLEVRLAGINKGAAVLKFIEDGNYDFILAVGDDKTDEDMFAALPEHAFTVKVGDAETCARFRLPSVRKVRRLLQRLSELDVNDSSEDDHQQRIMVQ